MVLGRECLISTIHYIRTAGMTFDQFMQDFKDMKYHHVCSTEANPISIFNQSTKVNNKNKPVLPNARYTITVSGCLLMTALGLHTRSNSSLLLLYF